MKRLLTSWDARRIFYLVGAIWIILQAIMDRMWFFLPVGLYFLYMAIYKVGCAGGNCSVNYESTKINSKK